MEHITAQIHNFISLLSNKTVDIRRHLHAFPELSGREKKTSEYIVHSLRHIGLSEISVQDNFGISALIRGKNASPCIGIRADMDALPIQEQNEIPCKSLNDGIMHACGHDVHMAVLLGVAGVLYHFRDALTGSVKLIFQPSEEVLPGGALAMIQNGVLENPHVDYMLGLHVLPELETGKIGIREGAFMASGDEIHLRINGKGGHAAFPATIHDPILCLSDILLSLEKEMQLQKKDNEPFVLKFGRFLADGRTNIVPSIAVAEGTLRTFDEHFRTSVHTLIQNTIARLCNVHNTQSDLNIVKGYPVLINEPQLTRTVRAGMEQLFGNNNIADLPQRMTCDDFAYFSQHCPSCYFRLGVKFPHTLVQRDLHTPTFDIDESALEVGVRAMTAAVLSCMEAF